MTPVFIMLNGLTLLGAAGIATRGAATTTVATISTTVTPAVSAVSPRTSAALGIRRRRGVGGKILLAIALAVADPHFDSKATDLRAGDSQSVVDVSTECVQRSTAFLEHLAASHFGATDAAADLDLDAFGTNPHSGSDGHLDSPAVGNTTLDLTGDAVSDDVGVNLRPLDLEDVDLDILLCDLLELFLELVNLLSTLTDDETGPCGVDSHGDELKSPLNDDLGDAGLRETVGQVLADLIILGDLLGVVAATPVGVPSTGDTDSVGNRVSFLSHN